MKEILNYEDFVREDVFADPSPHTLSRAEPFQFFSKRPDSICPFCNLGTVAVHEGKLKEDPLWLADSTGECNTL